MRNGLIITIALLFYGVLLVRGQSNAFRKGWNQRLDFNKYSLSITRAEKLKIVKQIITPKSTFYSYYKLYDYYFVVPVQDWDKKKQNVVVISGSPIEYKLNHIYVLDINQDGQPDLIHMPTDYGPFTRHSEIYFTDLLISTPQGYQYIDLGGYIINFKRNVKKQIVQFTVFVNACCDMPAHVLKYQINYKSNQATVTNTWVVP